MAPYAGDSYSQGTGLMPSFVKAMKLIMQSKTPLFTELKESKAVQRTHTWYFDRVASPTADNVKAEGIATVPAAPDDITEGTNYCAIYNRSYGVSGTQEATSFKSIANYLAYQKERAMKQLAMDIEYGLTLGAGASGASATARQMYGLYYWAVTSSYVTASSAATTGTYSSFATSTGEQSLNVALARQNSASPIDEPNFMLVSPLTKIMINRWTSTNTRWIAAGEKKLVATIGIYESSVGIIEVMMSNIVDYGMSASTANILGGNLDTLYLAWLRRPFSEPLAKTGDYTAFQCVAEGTLEARNPYAFFSLILS